MEKDLGVSVDEFIGPAPFNPFAAPDVSVASETGDLSSVQRKIVDFIENEARAKIAKDYGIQPPSIKIDGPDAEKARLELQRKQQEFFEKYKITKIEHDLLVSLIFYGELNLTFEALGHKFLIRDLTANTRRYIIEIGDRVHTLRGIAHLKIKAVSETLKEIDGIPMDPGFTSNYLWEMQGRLLDLLHKMHILTEEYKMHLYEKLPNFCRTPTSRMRYSVCNDMGIAINDPVFMAMSEEQIYWHYINAIKNQEIENNIINDRMEYLTWFINPEIAKKIKEKKEMSEESDLNKIQKYSFMNGIVGLIQRDMSDNQMSDAMEMVMKSMKGELDKKEEKDPWAEPKTGQALDPNDPFIQALNKKAQETPTEAQVGMTGGSDKWYK